MSDHCIAQITYLVIMKLTKAANLSHADRCWILTAFMFDSDWQLILSCPHGNPWYILYSSPDSFTVGSPPECLYPGRYHSFWYSVKSIHSPDTIIMNYRRSNITDILQCNWRRGLFFPLHFSFINAKSFIANVHTKAEYCTHITIILIADCFKIGSNKHSFLLVVISH